MKNLMRFAMVLALAGSALLYSGCTKDYQKDIDDLNSGVTTLQGSVQKLQEQVSALEALKSQIASLQGDVAPLQAAIDKNTEAIKKLQEGGYVTKDELDAELASLRDDTELALDALAELVADNVDAIDALKEAYEKTDAVAKALNLGKIASVALVREYIAKPAIGGATPEPKTYVSLNAWKLQDKAANKLYETGALLDLTYQVSPASLASSLNEDNVALRIYSPKKYDYIDVPVTITDADAETGLVSLYVDLFSASNKKNFDTGASGIADEDYYTPFALVINNESDNGVVNDIKSQYDFAHIKTVATPTVLTYFADFDDIEVPYDKFASSERKFFDGLEFSLHYSGEYYMTLEEAAALFGVDVEALTPTLAKKITTAHFKGVTADANATYINTDNSAWTAKMKATTIGKAKDALDDKANVEATASASIKIDGITKKVWEETQKYSVVNAEGSSIIMTPDEVITWKGVNTVDGTKALNFTTTKRIAAGESFFVYRTYKVNGTTKQINVLEVTEDGARVDVTPQTTAPAGFVYPDGYVAANFAEVPYSTTASDLEFIGTYTENDTDYDVTLTLKLGAKPADKKNLDLGTFRVDGSYTKNVDVDLSGIIAKLIGNDESLFDDVPTKTLKAGNADLTENPLYAAFAEHLYKEGGALGAVTTEGVGAQIEATSVIKETDETSTAMDETTFKFTFKVPQSNPDKGKDKSFLTLPLPTKNGETYVVGFKFTAFGVNYEGNLKVEIAETGNFYLKTTGLVGSDNVIPVTWHATANEDAVNPTIAIDEVDFAKYLVLNKDLKNEDVATLDLNVEVVLEGAKGTYTNNGQKYVYDGSFKDGGGTVSDADKKLTIIVNVDQTAAAPVYYKKELKTAATSKLVWDSFSGDQIKAKATLYKNHSTPASKAKVGETIELTLKRANQVKKMEVNTEKLTVGFTPGSPVTIDLAEILKLTSVINSTPLSGKGQLYVAATTDPITGDPIPEKPLIYNFKSHNLVTPPAFGLVDSANKFTAFTDGGTCSLGFTTSAGGSGDFTATYDEDIATAGSEKYTLTIPTTSLDVDYTVKFKVGLDLANIPETPTDYTPYTAEYAVDVELKLVRQ